MEYKNGTFEKNAQQYVRFGISLLPETFPNLRKR
jgi:hypothetical protein